MSELAQKVAENKNKSGIYPAGNRVVVQQDVIPEEVTDFGLVIPKQYQDAYQQAESCGELVAVGPDAFKHVTERVYHVHDNGKEFIEERVRGYSEPFAKVGDRISFAKYTGMVYKGKDKERYLVLNDEDITCRVDSEVYLTNLDTRKGMDND